MKNRSARNPVCLNRNDESFLDEKKLEELLDIEERRNAPLRTQNTRKSLEHYAERQNLRRRIADFDFPDVPDEH